MVTCKPKPQNQKENYFSELKIEAEEVLTCKPKTQNNKEKFNKTYGGRNLVTCKPGDILLLIRDADHRAVSVLHLDPPPLNVKTV